MKPEIGKDLKGRKVTVNPQALIAGHLLVQASSGGGKSWLIRKLLEETFGAFPHIVIDVEGELKTLRERFDYIVAGADDADCPANVRTAKLLARRVMELNASCIVDIYELKQFEKPMFVKEFVEALLHAPKNLWAPRLVVIDEAHLFAPEGDKKGQVSAAAICDLMGRGRKRGLGVVLATQRLSKLRKDAAGECRNKMVGFCNLLADRKRAADDLGFLGRDGLEMVRRLDTGQFFAVGPAISKKDVIQVQVGKVKTTHPRPGQNLQQALSPPKDKVKRLLKELKDLPRQAQEEAKTLAEAQNRIRELERELRTQKAPVVEQTVVKGPSKAELEEMGKQAVQKARRKFRTHVDQLHQKVETSSRGYARIRRNLKEARQSILAQLANLERTTKRISKECQIKLPKRMPTKPELPQLVGVKPVKEVMGTCTGRISTMTENISNRPKMQRVIENQTVGEANRLFEENRHIFQKKGLESIPPGNGELGGGARRLVEVLVRCMPAAFTKAQWASLADLSHKSGTFGTYLSKIRSMGLISEEHGLFRPTSDAIELIGLAPEQISVPKSNADVVEMWKRALGGTPAKMIDVIRTAFPEHISREDLASSVGITATSGTFGTYFSKLRSNNLVEVSGQMVRAGDPLLWEPGKE